MYVSEEIPEEISQDLKSEDYSDSGSDDEHAGHNVQIFCLLCRATQSSH